MSADLYFTRLWWYGQRGASKLHGRTVWLQTPPIICGKEVVMVDYVPEISLQRIQYPGESPRDMIRSPVDEVKSCDEFLLTTCR